jgi:replicative DNA helicase
MNKQTGDAEFKKGVLMTIGDQPPVADNTTIMLYMAREVAVKEHTPMGYFSTCMGNVEVVNRLLAIITGIDREKFATGMLDESDWKALDERMPKVLEAPLFVDDTQMPVLAELLAKIKALVNDHGVSLIIVNTTANVVVDGKTFDSDQAHLEYINAALKALAEELCITIIAVEK